MIVGLGNPGIEYAKTRHNAGFMVLEKLAHRHGLSGGRSRFQSRVVEGRLEGHHTLLALPNTFMNRSGAAVVEALRFYKLDPETDLLVVVDDVALDLGQIRIRPEGGAGGHNGLADIERSLGTRAYGRLRIGIGPVGPVPQADFVLGQFTRSQLDQLAPVCDRACDAISCWLGQGAAEAMNRYNASQSKP